MAVRPMRVLSASWRCLREVVIRRCVGSRDMWSTGMGLLTPFLSVLVPRPSWSARLVILRIKLHLFPSLLVL